MTPHQLRDRGEILFRLVCEIFEIKESAEGAKRRDQIDFPSALREFASRATRAARFSQGSSGTAGRARSAAVSATSRSPIVSAWRPAWSAWRARQRIASIAFRSSKLSASGIGAMKFDREYFTRPSTLSGIDLCLPQLGVASSEQVAERTRVKHRCPPLPAMRCPVMSEMTALTKRRQVSGIVVARILVEMSGGEDDIGRRQGQGCKAC